MDITRDVFLTDGRSPYFTLTLASRDLHAHRILSGLTRDEHDHVAEALVVASATIAGVLRAAHAREGRGAATASFGCGT